MPLHAYVCNACEHQWENLEVKSTDKAPEACECEEEGCECKSTDIRRLMGSPTAIWGPNDGCGGWSANADGSAFVKTQTGGDKVGGARPDEQ